MEEFSEHSKLWVYQSDRVLKEQEIEIAENALADFCLQWTAHNNQLKATYKILYKRFIVLVVDETHNDASGCSIDKSVAFLKSLEQRLNISLFNRMQMAYIKSDEVIVIDYNEIAEAYKSGHINESTLFFNTGIDRLKKLETELLIPLKQHWLYSRLPIRH